VVISGFLSVGTVVEVMKLGALDVIEKPIDIDEIVRVACASSNSRKSRRRRIWLGACSSSLDRWPSDGWLRDQGCAAKADFKTLDCWARETAVSYNALCAVCRIVGIRPARCARFHPRARAETGISPPLPARSIPGCQ
jgi:DNA-binding response OmpR family regulator